MIEPRPRGGRRKRASVILPKLFEIDEANRQCYAVIKEDLNAIPDRARKAAERVARLDNRLQVVVEDICV